MKWNEINRNLSRFQIWPIIRCRFSWFWRSGAPDSCRYVWSAAGHSTGLRFSGSRDSYQQQWSEMHRFQLSFSSSIWIGNQERFESLVLRPSQIPACNHRSVVCVCVCLQWHTQKCTLFYVHLKKTSARRYIFLNNAPKCADGMWVKATQSARQKEFWVPNMCKISKTCPTPTLETPFLNNNWLLHL